MMQLVVASYRPEDHPLLDEIVSLRRHKSLSQGTLEEIAQATGFRCSKCDQPIDCRQFPVHRKRWLACTVEGPEQSVQLLQLLMKWGKNCLESCSSLTDFCRSRQVCCYSCNQATPQQRLPDYLKINWREAMQPAAAVQEETVATTGGETRPASAARSNGSAQVDPPGTATHKANAKNLMLNVKQEPVDDYTAHVSPKVGPHASTSASAAVNGCEHGDSSARQNGHYAEYNEEKPLPMPKRSPPRQENEEESSNRGVNLAHKDVLKGYILARTMDLVPNHLLRKAHIKTEPQEHDTQSNGIGKSSQLDPEAAQCSSSLTGVRSHESHTPIPAVSVATTNVSLRSLLIQQAKVAPLDPKEKEMPRDAIPNNSTGVVKPTTEAPSRTENPPTNETTKDKVSQKRPRPVAPPFPRKTKQFEPVMSDSASTTSSAPSQSSFIEPWSLGSCFTSVISEPVRGGNSITCKVCNKVLKVRHNSDYAHRMKQLLTAHVLRHMNKEAYGCTLCDFESNYQPSITKHLEKKHSPDRSAEFEDRTKRMEYKEEAQALLHECFVVLQ